MCGSWEKFYRRLGLVGLFVWMLILHLSVYAAESEKVDPARFEIYRQIKGLNLGHFIPRPDTRTPPQFMDYEAVPRQLRTKTEYREVEEILKFARLEDYKQAYLKSDQFIKKHPTLELSEWVYFLKADFLYRRQSALEEPRYNLVVEEYQDASRRFPLHPEIARALYQLALLHLKTEFYAAVETTAQRALRDFGKSKFAPYLLLLSGEQALRTQDDIKAVDRFDQVIKEFPRSQPAVDAAFRKAYLLFHKGKFKQALETYEQLEKYHGDVFTRLKLLKEPSSTDKYLDRIYYAESVYLNRRYKEASELFQGLANIFPRHELAPYLWIRFGDTYLFRGEATAAENAYAFVVEDYQNEKASDAYARIRLADLYFLTKSLNGYKKSDDLYRKAIEIARKINDKPLLSLGLSRLISFHMALRNYRKAQAAVVSFLETFVEDPNRTWVEEQNTRILELEILDHYKVGDYLAALTVFLVNEGKQLDSFKDTQVMLRLSESASLLGLLDKAESILNRVVYIEKSKEGRQEALLRLIEILIRKGDIRKASERLRRFNFAYPTTAYRYLYEMQWGDLYTRLKNSERAVKHYERTIQAAKNKPKDHFNIRFAYTRMAEHYVLLALPLRAIEAFKDYIALVSEIEKNPTDERILTSKDKHLAKVSRYRIADIYFGMHDFVKALSAYQKVSENVKEEPFYSHAKYRIGECYLALGDRDAAMKAFAAVAQDDSENLWARAASSYIESVKMEVNNGIRIFN